MAEPFTPGPWEVGMYPWIVQQFEEDGVEGEVAQANARRAEFEANARLIAACPTMYAYILARSQEGDERAAEIIKAIG